MRPQKIHLARLALSSDSARSGPLLTFAMFLTCLLAQVSLAHAQEDPSALARAQYRKAFEAVEARNWNEARDLLLDLWSRSRTYDVAGLLAEVEKNQARHAAAAQYFAFVLENVPPRERADTVEQIRRALRAMKERVATVHLEIEPKSADVRIDGQPLAFSPLPTDIYVEPGERTFAAVLGDQRAVERLKVSAGQEYELTLRIPDPSLPQPGLSDDSSSDSSSTNAQPLDSGTPQRSLVPMYVGAALTAVGVGAWVGFGIDARAARSDANTYRQQIGTTGCDNGATGTHVCQQAQESYDRQRRSALLGNIGMGVAATAGVATVAYLLFWPNPKEHPTGVVAWQPTFALDDAGGSLGVSGTF